VAAKLRRPPFDVLAFDSRTQEAATLADDPIARASTRLLGAAAIAALALALLAVALGIASDVRDDANELFELEAQGLAPRDLRQHVRVRSAITVLAGIVGGIVLAVGLSLLVVDLVALAAGSVSPEPPLLVTTDWPLVSAVGIAALVAAAALAAAIASAAFRTESVGTARRQP
jgi:ABC-type antimicrobial peptide transport system permease subunit